MAKKILSLILCVTLLAALCSCGAKEEKDPLAEYYGKYVLVSLESTSEELTEEVLARSLEMMNGREGGPVTLEWGADGVKFSGLGAGTDSASIDLDNGVFTVSEDESYPLSVREDGAIVISVDSTGDYPFDMVFARPAEGSGSEEETQQNETQTTDGTGETDAEGSGEEEESEEDSDE